MRKGSGIDTVDSYVRIPRETYAKLVKSKKQTESRSINKRLCSILDEYFAWKESEAQKQIVS